MKVTAIIEIGKDTTYDIYTNDNELGFMLMGQGRTIAEAKEDLLKNKETLERYYGESGEKFDFSAMEFEYKYDTVSFLKYSPFTLTWLSTATGINKKQLSHYATGLKHPSHRTMVKIQNAVNTFIKDYQQVVFE